MTSPLSRLGRAAAHRWRRTLLVSLIVVAGIGTLGSALGAGFVDDYRTPGVDSTRAQELLEARFPSVSGADATLVFAGDRSVVTGDGVQATLRTVAGQPHVTGVSEPQVVARRHGRVRDRAVRPAGRGSRPGRARAPRGGHRPR